MNNLRNMNNPSLIMNNANLNNNINVEDFLEERQFPYASTEL